MPADHMTVGIILATLNEIEGMKWFMPQLKQEWYDELIVVDGGSTDGTVEYCKEHGYTVFLQQEKGLPRSHIEAFQKSTSDILVYLTPDGNSLPEFIPEMVAKVREGYDMVIASRYKDHAQSHDDDFITGLGNHMFTKIINVLWRTQYTDTLVGYRAFRREAVYTMKLDTQDREHWLRKKVPLMNTWEVGGCIRAAKLGLSTYEVPADEPKRIGGERKMRPLRNGMAVVLHILYELWIGTRFK